jgi:hypothetical protein
MTVEWNVPVVEDANTVLIQDLEDFYEQFSAKETVSKKSELIEGLKLCAGVTSRGSLIVRTRQGGINKMKTADVKRYAGTNKVAFKNDEPVVETLFNFMMEAKRKLKVVNE